MKSFFSQEFLDMSSTNITEEISRNSFFSKESILNSEIIDKIMSETELFKIKFNSVDISAVHDQDGYYMSNGLAKSKTLFDLLTSEKILDISQAYLGDKFRLKCHRVYSVSPGAKNPWHTDDKKYGEKNENIKGIVFIIYLNDVFNGEFQAVRNSHLFSKDFKYPNFDTHIVKKYKDKIKSFKMPKGSIVIFDNKTIHRAKPYLDFFWRRKSLFFQVDNDIKDGEKILLNAEFLNNLNTKKNMFLGLGFPSKMPHEPAKTGLDTINLKTVGKVQLYLFLAIYRRLYFNIKFFISDKIKRIIQGLLGKKIKVNSKD